MKKLASILLLLLLLFNYVGYRLLSEFLQSRSDCRLEAKLDRDEYDESRLVEIQIPLNLPYYIDRGYERFDGEIEINGIHYKYVKKKVHQGNLVLLCIPHLEKEMIQSVTGHFFTLVNDLQQHSSGNSPEGGNSSFSKSFLSEYRQQMNNWDVIFLIPVKPTYSIANSFLLPTTHTRVPEQPPEC